MYGEITPSTDDEFGDLEELEEKPINWDEYTEHNYTEMQEALEEFVSDNLTIQKYIRRDYSGYMDHSFSEDQEIDNAIDCDLEENETIETDEYDQEGDTQYLCTDCDKTFFLESNFMEHAIEWIYANNDTEQMQQKIIRPSQFLCLLVDHIWNKQEGKSYTEYMEQYIRSDPNRLHNFFNYMVQKGTIPTDIWDTYNEILFIE